MVAPILAAAGGKASKQASEGLFRALTGDLAVIKGKTAPRVVGRGKRKHTRPAMDWELHVNPLHLLIGGAVALVGGGLALWMTQQKLSKGDDAKHKVRIVKTMTEISHLNLWWDANKVFHADKVIDRPASVIVETALGIPILHPKAVRAGKDCLLNTEKTNWIWEGAVDVLDRTYLENGQTGTQVTAYHFRHVSKKGIHLGERKGFSTGIF